MTSPSRRAPSPATGSEAAGIAPSPASVVPSVPVTTKSLAGIVSGDVAVSALGGVASLAHALGTDADLGLPASRVEANRAAHGANKLPDKPVRSFLSHLVEAFEDGTLQILVLSAIVSVLFGIFLSDSKADLIQGLAIVAAVVIVSGVNSVQNWSKETEFKELNKIKDDFKVKVRRDGHLTDVQSSSVVVGDIVVLESGDKLPCDGVLTYAIGLTVNQSQMNGESVPVAKEVDGDIIMMGGTTVQQGEGRFLVTAVGVNSEVGKTITTVEEEEDKNTPLQDKLSELADQIGTFGTAAGGLTVAVLTLLWWLTPVAEGAAPKAWTDLIRFVIVGVTIVVVAVPEGLPLAVTISLAFSMRKMMKDNVLVRKLPACETMGSATVIASDKTGTLTENKMSVEEAFVFEKHFAAGTVRSTFNDAADLVPVAHLRRAIVLNSTAEVDEADADAATAGAAAASAAGRVSSAAAAADAAAAAAPAFKGNPTEGALLALLQEGFGVDCSKERRDMAPLLLARRPFAKEAKYMSSLYAAGTEGAAHAAIAAAAEAGAGAGGRAPARRTTRSAAAAGGAVTVTSAGDAMLYVKGAPEVVLEMCSGVLTNGPDVRPINPEHRSTLLENTEKMAARGFRTLAVAFRRLRASDIASASGGELRGDEPLDAPSTKARYRELLVPEASPEGAGAGAGISEAVRSPLEGELVLLGLFGIADPLRPGVVDSLRQCMAAGISVMMVTGDHITTATHIAQQAGILPHADRAIKTLAQLRSMDAEAADAVLSGRDRTFRLVLEGREFRALTTEQRTAICGGGRVPAAADGGKAKAKGEGEGEDDDGGVGRAEEPILAVLARSSPTDKHLAVEALQRSGHVVAVTGDGTNDAAALRKADVGLAMGIAGTEIAKEASAIVIMDDNFSSIVSAVRWGRSIKENIRKFLTFQLTINIVALLLTFITACRNGGSTDQFPLTPVQLLWVNLIMDSFAALALATEPPSQQLMQYRSGGRSESLITGTMRKNMIGHALFQTALLIWLAMTDSGAAFFGVTEGTGSVKHFTTVFTTFVALQIFNLFNCRTTHDELNVLQGFTDSVVAQVIIIIIVVMQVVMVQFGGTFTQTEPLSLVQWAQCVALGFSSIPVGYLLKLLPEAERQLTEAPPRLPSQREMRTVSAVQHTAAVAEEAAASTSVAASTATPSRRLRSGREF